MTQPKIKNRAASVEAFSNGVGSKGEDATWRGTSVCHQRHQRRGVFLYCDFALPPNSPIQFTLIPPPEITGAERKWVCCYGRVARVEENTGGRKRGIAVETERIVFLPEITG